MYAMDINIPGPMNPEYFASIRFSLVSKSEIVLDVGDGRLVSVAELAVVTWPRGLPV